MSIQCWFCHPRDGMTPDPDGEWVRYDDHAAEVERLQARERELEAALQRLGRLANKIAETGLAAVSAETEDDDE